jgi:hypothetical protein
MTGKSKILEAAFKDKEIDPYFCMGLVLSQARSIFYVEITKAAEVYFELCDN